MEAKGIQANVTFKYIPMILSFRLKIKARGRLPFNIGICIFADISKKKKKKLRNFGIALKKESPQIYRIYLCKFCKG